MHYTMKILGLLLLVALLESGCKKETDCDDPTNMECSNYDPCYRGPLTGDFTMEEILGYGFSDEPYRTTYPNISATVEDTAMKGRTIVFTALDEADRYEWTIGADPRVFRERTVELSFFSSEVNLTPTTLAIKLRAYRDNPYPCYPEDTVSESVRFITIVPRSYTALTGKYKGISDFSPSDSFIVDIYQDTSAGGSSNYYYMHGLTPNCDLAPIWNGPVGLPVLPGYSKGFFENDIISGSWPACYRSQGIIELSDNRQDIRIQYYLRENAEGDEVYDEFVFMGRRVD